MKIKTLLSSLFTITALIIIVISSSSFSGGFGGAYQNTPNCQGCHGFDGNTIVSINGLPSTGGYTPGATYPITVTVTNASKLAAGFQIQTTAGTFTNAGAGVVINGSGVTAGHTGGAKAMASGTATFNLDWQAPSTGGATASFNAEGNAVNLNSGTSGDGANVASNVLVPLPVHFVSFDLYNLNNTTQVTFETADEENIDRFEIERSINGTEFETIAYLTPLSNGKYKFVDSKVINNIKYFYRIKEVDVDSKFTYSEVRQIVLSASDLNIKLYPTQVNHQVINIKGLKDYNGLNLEVYSIIGLQVANLNIDHNQFHLNDLSNGSYIVRLMRNNNVLKTQKITVGN